MICYICPFSVNISLAVQESYARQVLPCLDEPPYRAEFNLAVEVRLSLTLRAECIEASIAPRPCRRACWTMQLVDSRSFPDTATVVGVPLGSHMPVELKATQMQYCWLCG